MWIICTFLLLYVEMGAKVMWAATDSGANIGGYPGGNLFAAARKIRQPESRNCTWTNSICALYIVFVTIWLSSFVQGVFTHLQYRNYCHQQHVNNIHIADRTISLDALWWAAGGARTIAKIVDPPFDEHQSVRFANIKVDPLMCSKVHGTVPNVKNMHIASLNFTLITKLNDLSSQPLCEYYSHSGWGRLLYGNASFSKQSAHPLVYQ